MYYQLYNQTMVPSTSSASKTQGVSLTLYLKHFRNSTIDYVLSKTGYRSITEYEDLCRNTDSFPIQVSPNGVIQSTCAEVDYSFYRVFEFSVHHLNEKVVSHLMTHYLGMSQLDYELLHPAHNTIVILIPYHMDKYFQMNGLESEEDISDEEVVCVPKVVRAPKVVKKEVPVQKKEVPVQKKEVPVQKKEVPVQKKEFVPRRIVIVEDDEDDVPLVPASKSPLSGWKFWMNSSTQNSYILTPPGAVQSVKKGTVSWVGGTTPTSWTAPLKGIDRPVYYNKTSCGWIVSLRLRDQLVSAGAREQK